MRCRFKKEIEPATHFPKVVHKLHAAPRGVLDRIFHFLSVDGEDKDYGEEVPRFGGGVRRHRETSLPILLNTRLRHMTPQCMFVCSNAKNKRWLSV